MSDCIGSGHCCNKNLCSDGVAKHGNILGPCPSLVWDEEKQRHWCGLVLNGEITGKSLYIGAGCCAPWNSWRDEPLQDRTWTAEELDEWKQLIKEVGVLRAPAFYPEQTKGEGR